MRIQRLILAALVLPGGLAFGDWAKVEPILVEHCYSCHDADTEKGDFNLEALAPEFLDAEKAGHWIEVMDNLNASEMPPSDKPQPSGAERALVTEWIAKQLEQARRQGQATGGRTLLRRLTRAEYENTVRDLLGVIFEPGKNPGTLLPPDGAMDGFDRVSQGLHLDPSLMAKYFEVAQVVADRAVQLGDPPVPTIRTRLEYEEYDTGLTRGSIYRALDRTKRLSPDGSGVISHEANFRTYGQLRHPYSSTMIPVPGKYAIRFRAGTDPGASGEPVFVVMEGVARRLFFGELKGTLENPAVEEIIVDLDGRSSGEISTRLVKRPRGADNLSTRDRSDAASAAARAGDLKKAGLIKARMNAEGHYGFGRPDIRMLKLGDVPRLYMDYIEIEGPLYEQWPPKSVEMLLPGELEETSSYLKQVVARLLPRAFRRPVTGAEIDRVTAVAETEWKATDSFEAGLKAAVVTTLCSPSFLYLLEPGSDDAQRRLSEHELASRLSYFLWSTLPDEELTRLARAGQVRAELDAQIRRMLAHDHSESLVDGFARQWLKADEFDRFTPDLGYREFYEDQFNGLNAAMNREPLAFFREIARSGGDLRDFLSADWTMANEKLARWYGVPDGTVAGEKFARVSLPAGSPRGGLLGMGAVHKWGSDGSRTKPVERGKYVLDVLFNDPPNPPPPNVGEVEPNVQGKKLTVRQRLEAHREIESCANCHSRLDPYGLAMENFNVVSEWRDFQDGENTRWRQDDHSRIDPSGTLPNGTTFSSFVEYKAALRKMEDPFFHGFSEKLFTYAFGRAPEPVDRGLIDEMVGALKASNGKFETAVRTIINSETFQTK